MTTPSFFYAASQLVSLLSRREKWQLVKMLGFACCVSVLEMITATTIVVLAQVLNNPEAGRKYLTFSSLTFNTNEIVFYIALGVGLTYLLKNCLAMAEVFFQHYSIQQINYRFKKKLLARYAQVDYNFYLTRNSSQGHAVISSDTDSVFSNGMVSLSSIFSEAIVFIALVAIIIYIQPLLALYIFTVGVLLAACLVKGLFPLFYRWGQKVQEFSLQGEKNLLQFFHAFKEIVLIGKRDSFINAYHFYSRKKSRVQAIQNATNVLPRLVTELLFVTLFVLTIAYFCLNNEKPAQMIGILGGYLYVGFRLMPGLNRIITQLNTFKSIIPSINRVAQEYHSIAAQEYYVDCPTFDFKRNICLQNVSFKYLNTTADALKNITLEIEKGACIGIIGETGSGKSTLCDIILGLLRPQTGSISIDQQYPVNSIQWHAMIGYVQQAIYLIDDTIWANIAFGESLETVDFEKLELAIAGAQLQSFISQLPQGIETIVGERGMRLSGGERQRIAIARALYRQPDVFIFDEATSALDNETEARLMATIDTIRQTERTIIIIAHRLTTLKNCDKIVVMRQGAIDRVLSYSQLQQLHKLA